MAKNFVGGSKIEYKKITVKIEPQEYGNTNI